MFKTAFMSIMFFILCVFITACGIQNTSALEYDSTLTSENTYTKEYEKHFNNDKVIDIKINIDKTEYADMLKNAQDEKYKSANIIFDGVSVENVGFRTKGNLTLKSLKESDSDRYSFRIKLDKYVDGQNLDGLDEFVINNMYSDASYMREYLSYELLKKIGINVPKCVFANIYINNELKGLYLCVEAIDDSYIERVFNNTTGNLYKGENNSNLVYKENDNYESLELKMGNDTEKSGLKNLIKVLNSIDNDDSKNIEDILDIDTVLKYIAFNYVFSNYDSYQGNNGNNYYLYENDGIFSIIPWDFNMSFGGFMRGGNGKISMPIADNNPEKYPLVSKLLSINSYKEKYYSYVKELLNYCEGLEDRVNEVKELIYDYVKNDPTKFCTIEDFEKATTYSEDEKENSFEQYIPQETIRNFKENSEKPEPPINFDGNTPPEKPDNDTENKPSKMRGNMNGHGDVGKHGIMNNTSSIVNFIRNRIDNINSQLKEL